MSTQMPEVGDRYVWDGCHVVVAMISEAEDLAQVRILNPETGFVAFAYEKIPLADSFVWVGTTAGAPSCDHCGTNPPEVGMIYCMECVDELAAEFSSRQGREA